MGLEIERKFVVQAEDLPTLGEGVAVVQGYLSTVPACTVRVRISTKGCFLTLKGEAVGPARPEFEYPVPEHDAEGLMQMAAHRIEKTRYYHRHHGHTWEIDVFEEDNAPLIVAEVEMGRVDEPVVLPDWLGEEVTEDHRYTNAWLSQHPYATWGT